MKKLERRIDFVPAFDRRDSDPKKNYGVHGAEIRWYLIGKKGVIQFVIYTGWNLPGIKNHEPIGADVGYHSHKPKYEGQHKGPCNVLKGHCYYGGSSLRAEEWLKTLIEKGSDEIWKMMEKEYTRRFA